MGKSRQGLPRGSARALRILASEGPLTGLQIIKASHGKLKRGTVYVWLQVLADKGLVAREKGDAGLVFHATDAGVDCADLLVGDIQ